MVWENQNPPTLRVENVLKKLQQKKRTNCSFIIYSSMQYHYDRAIGWSQEILSHRIFENFENRTSQSCMGSRSTQIFLVPSKNLPNLREMHCRTGTSRNEMIGHFSGQPVVTHREILGSAIGPTMQTVHVRVSYSH